MSDLRKLLDECTKGPWKAHEFKCSFSIFQRDVKPGYQRRIADVIYWDAGNISPQNPMREDADANARLIAIAPDLAAALLKAEEALDDAIRIAARNEAGPDLDAARATLTEIRKITGGK